MAIHVTPASKIITNLTQLSPQAPSPPPLLPPKLMPEFKKGKARTPIPQFGEWNKKRGVVAYTRVFSRVRADRKLNKFIYEHQSFASNNEELIPRHHRDDISPQSKRRSLLRCFSCCGKM